MTFNVANLSMVGVRDLVNPLGLVNSQRWDYNTPDTLAQVKVANYWVSEVQTDANPDRLIRDYDLIAVTASDGIILMRVQANGYQPLMGTSSGSPAFWSLA